MRRTEEYRVHFADAEPPKKQKNTEKHKFGVYDVFDSLMVALLVITLLFTFFFRVISVTGPSMRPTLHDKDKLIVSTIGYTPQRGDIVVLSRANELDEPIIKRIIAVGGDTVDISFTTGEVTVNGVKEEYTNVLTNQQFDIAFPITVPQGTVFVLGDNRGDSLDSRSTLVGCVNEQYILGHVLFRFYPLGSMRVK